MSPEQIQNAFIKIGDGLSLRQIAKEYGCGATTLYDNLVKTPELTEQYARAKEVQAETLADEIVQIADDGQNDTYKDDEGNETTNHDVIARSRLRVDARKWVAAKLLPKKYGDKVTNEHTGANGAPIQFERIERVIISSKAT